MLAGRQQRRKNTKCRGCEKLEQPQISAEEVHPLYHMIKPGTRTTDCLLVIHSQQGSVEIFSGHRHIVISETADKLIISVQCDQHVPLYKEQEQLPQHLINRVSLPPHQLHCGGEFILHCRLQSQPYLYLLIQSGFP